MFASYGSPEGTYVSRDGGHSWQPTTLRGCAGNCVPVFSANYAQDHTIVAINDQRVHLSTDEGRTWSLLGRNGSPSTIDLGGKAPKVVAVPDTRATSFSGRFQYTLAPGPVVEPAALGPVPVELSSTGLATGTYTTTLRVSMQARSATQQTDVSVMLRVADGVHQLSAPIVVNGFTAGW